MKRSSEAVLPRDFLVSMPVSFLRTFVAPASNAYRRRIPITINSVLINSIPFSSIVLLVLYLAFFPPLRCDNEHSLDSLNIPEDHIPYFLNSHPHLKARYCSSSTASSCNEAAINGHCWGYEKSCDDPAKRYFPPMPCPGDSRSWAATKEDQQEQFFQHGDFGYLRKRMDELVPICSPRTKSDSSLTCSQYLRYCQGRHLYVDFRKMRASESTSRYREDLFTQNQIGGSCELDSTLLSSNGGHKSSLQSWFAELQSFSSLSFKPSKSKRKCDVRIAKPTFFVKLDAGINMFHHFCDFINLYMSQHMNGSFEMDVNIVMWDTSTKTYRDLFDATWAVFSKNPIIPLSSFDGKRVCFDQFVFGLLPRMRFGHFYNMPLMPGCHGTGLYKAFTHHVLHRLSVPQRGPKDKVRVTILERRTKYRNVLNQEELVRILRRDKSMEVQVVHYSSQIPLTEQLTSTHNTDVFIGMHGAGLTHLLFLPDWAATFELYACDDDDCYSNLARLRGVRYFTWEKKELMYPKDEGRHPTTGGPHPKFTDYTFDAQEFHRIVRKAVDYVKEHPAYQNAEIIKDEL